MIVNLDIFNTGIIKKIVLDFEYFIEVCMLTVGWVSSKTA